MDDLYNMTIFARVIDEESFSAAAEQLGITRSAVSKQVTNLEKRLGARLINRTTRSLSLTEVGELVYQRAKQISSEWEEVQALVSDHQGEVKGKLRIGAPLNFGQEHVAPHIPRFLETYPDVQVELQLTDTYVNIIQEGLDAAIRLADLPDSTLIATKLADNQLILVAAPSYLEKKGVPQQVEDLKEHNCLVYYTKNNTFENWQYVKEGESKTIRVSGNYKINDAKSIIKAVNSGSGICLATRYMAHKALKSGQLVELLPDVQFKQSRPIYLVYPAREYVPPKTRAFINFMRESIGSKPYWD